MLSIRNIDVSYGQVQALFNISIEVGEKEIISIIGANGAGKSTLMKSIMGVQRAHNGSIALQNEDITRTKTHRIVEKGIVYVPEGREVFPNMTVQENLEMGAYCRPYKQNEIDERLEEMYTLFPRLKERRKQKTGSLSGGEQQMVAITRGLMSEPKLIMFDEPSLGLAPVIVDEMFDAIVRINTSKNLPVLLVEQNAFMALSISSRCYVLENGHITDSGPSAELMESESIKTAYLGH